MRRFYSRSYVIDKVSKGREAARKGQMFSTEDLLKEAESW
jgi:hypothetical protein